ncbi:unnamed protein product [Lota lota]
MSIHMPMARAFLWQTLARNTIPSIGHKRCRKLHKYNVQSRVHEVRRFSVGPNKMDEDDSRKVRQDVSLVRRRPLSPLERISLLLPQESLGPEVEQLRDCDEEITDENLDIIEDSNTRDASVLHCHDTKNNICDSETPIKEISVPQEDIARLSNGGTVADCSDVQSQVGETPSNMAEPLPTSLPRENLLEFGELLIAEFRKKGRVEFKKMFQLQEGVRLHSSWGTINHDDMAGRPSGRFMRTTHWAPILIRRPSLEDYVLLMKRGPAIAYPKDASMMLTMMDVSEGDCVLESGSGSGAMSLFLSRAVGSKGTVLSVEVREDHLSRAVKNYNRWRSSWGRRRGDEWPDNVHFHQADLCSASSLLDGLGFHSVALDLISPQLVLPTVVPHLHPGAVCAVYLANITQVVDLLDGIRCSSLPLLCERIIEVPIRDWLVAPARQKDGDYCTRKSPLSNKDKKLCGMEEKEESTTANDARPFGSVPYISRPHPEQLSHTAFLVKLRKYVQ